MQEGVGMTTCYAAGTAILAGGPGARCAPGGEREGQSPLARREREGQSPLARREREGQRRLARREREGQSPLARREREGQRRLASCYRFAVHRKPLDRREPQVLVGQAGGGVVHVDVERGVVQPFGAEAPHGLAQQR